MTRFSIAGIISICLSACIALSVAAPVSAAMIDYENAIYYNEYINNMSEDSRQGDSIILTADNISAKTDDVKLVGEYSGKKGNIVLTSDKSSVTFKANLMHSGFYCFELEYCAIKGNSKDIIRQININGKLPFDEARNIVFSRLYKDTKSEPVYDKNGNQILCDTEEVFDWQTKTIRDSNGYNTQPLMFYLEKGENSITFISVDEAMALSALRIFKYEPLVEYELPQGKKGKDFVKIQGEKPQLKSDQSIVALADRSSPAVEPVCNATTVFNTVGGINWQYNGQFIEYEFNISHAGLYKIALKNLQNFSTGSVSFRKIYIDGKVPFSQLQSIKFEYSTSWENKVLGEDVPFAFFFDEGKHTIRMEVTLGEMGIVLSKIQSEVDNLNRLYRELLMVVGSTPDVNRDYQFEKIMPETISQLRSSADRIIDIYNDITDISRMENSNAQFMKRFYELLIEITDDTSKIASQFSNFQTYISSMGDFLMTSQKQPLTVDYISVIPFNAEFEKATSGFIDSIVYNVKLFLYSFINEYSDVNAKKSDKRLVIWSGSGRDQAQIIRNLTEMQFTPEYGIQADVMLVPGTALLPAVFAGTGPDVVLGTTSTEAANLSFRGALANLAEFSDFSDISKRFSPSAMTPLEFDGTAYALPETQSFYVMFYRKDILSELGVEIPDSWEDVVTLLPILQKKQMNFGISTGNLNGFVMMLYQNGEALYSKDCTSTAITGKKAIKLFDFFTSFYTLYEIPQSFDFLTRFRFGTIPIGIADYTLYNQLSVSAPELNNMWGITNVPGHRKEDGTLDHTTVSVSTGCIILDSCSNKEQAWEYLKWWTSSEIQLSYGKQLENILGKAARYATANLEAFSMLPWSRAEDEALNNQRGYARGIPEVPGGYYLSRNIDFAFRGVVNNGRKSGDSLVEAAKSINREIILKREELGFGNGGEAK